MDSQGLVHHRKKRALARTLGAFETLVEGLVGDSDDAKRKVRQYKQTVRNEFESLATDACDYMTFNGEVNGAAIDLRDRVSPGAPSSPSARKEHVTA